MTDELENLAKEIVFRNGGIACPNASAGNQDCPESAPCSCCASAVDRIASALRTLRSKTRKEDAKIAEDIANQVWKRVVKIDEIRQAILKKEEEDERTRL